MPTHPQKVIYVITKANWGGAQRYVFDLAVGAKAQGYDVVVAVGEAGVLTEKLAASGIRTIPFGLRQRRTFIGDLLTFGSLFSLIRIFRLERPNIVHVNSAKAGGLGALAARITGVPHIIFTAHGWEFNADRSMLSKAGIMFFSWLTVLLAHKTIAVSSALRRDARYWPLISRRVSVVHNGLTCRLTHTREEARAILAPHTVGRYWIGMISELHPTKRVDDAIRACSLVIASHPEVILVVIGEGRERENLEELIRELKMQNHIFLVGFKNDASSLLTAFDLFVHSSRSEALAFAILEAGCASLPVVATRVGGIPEIITDEVHGLLVPPYNPDELAKAIDSLIQKPQYAAELGARLHARIQTTFSKEKMLAETFALYQR